jgi:hypothetical protein
MKAFLAKYSITTHTLVVCTLFLIGAYHAVPAFQALCLQLWGIIPASVKVGISGIGALVMWYWNGGNASGSSAPQSQKGFARLAVLPLLAVLAIGALTVMIACSSNPQPQTGQPTPWQKVVPALNATQTLNDTVLQTVINANQAGLLSKDATAKVLLEQARVSDVVEQLNAIVKQGSAATSLQAAQVAALIAQIQASANTMVNAGDLGVKSPGSQQTVLAVVNGLASSADVLLEVLSAAGVALPATPSPPPVVTEPSAPPVPTKSSSFIPVRQGPLVMNLAGAAGLPGLLLVILPLVLQEAPLIAADVVKLKSLFSQAGLTPEQIDAQLVAIEADTTTIAEQDIAEANQWLVANGYLPYAHTPPSS